MEILSYISLIYQKLDIYVLVYTRIIGMLTVFVVFRHDYVSPKILIGFAALLSIFAMLFNSTLLHTQAEFSTAMLVSCGFQFLIGFSAGLIMNLVFEIFNAAGQIIATQIGLNIASLFDPRLGSITGLTRFYFLCLVLIFLLLNGHLEILKMLIKSFDALPITTYFMPKKLLSEIMQYSSVIFTVSMSISLRVVIAMMLLNISLAIMTRFAPQFNVFSIGTNMTLVFGIIYVYSTFHIFIGKGSFYLNQGMNIIGKYLVKAH